MSSLNSAYSLITTQGQIVWPLLLTLWIAWGDERRRGIPNYVAAGIAAAGLTYHCGMYGWPSLLDGIAGLTLAFGLLLIPYRLGGIGPGYVKTLAALGAWLGVWRTLFLFSYMGAAAALLTLYVLWSRGELVHRVRFWGAGLFNWVLRRSPGALVSPAQARFAIVAVPYGLVIVLAMLALVLKEI